MKITLMLCLVLALTGAGRADSAAGPPSLAGRKVILVVAPHRTDPQAQHLEGRLSDYRARLGLNSAELPILLIGVDDSGTQHGLCRRLGLRVDDTPVVCLVQWGDPARFGPRQVIGHAIVRRATGVAGERAVVVVLHDWLEQSGRSDLVPQLEHMSGGAPGAGKLQIVKVAFQATGRPMYLADARVRLRNVGVATVPAGTLISYWALPRGHTRWIHLGTQRLGRLAGGYDAVRDVMVNTREFGLLDKNEGILPCRYRVEVTRNGHTISREGQFVPQKPGN